MSFAIDYETNDDKKESPIDRPEIRDKKPKSNELTQVVEIHPPPPYANDEIVPETPTTPSTLVTPFVPPPPPPPPLENELSTSSTTSTMSSVTLKSNHSISGNIHIFTTHKTV